MKRDEHAARLRVGRQVVAARFTLTLIARGWNRGRVCDEVLANYGRYVAEREAELAALQVKQ